MKMMAVFWLASALVIDQSAYAQQYHEIGMGTQSCGAWTAARRDPQDRATVATEQWILGFLSGIGYFASPETDPLRGVDADAVWAWTDNYCHTQPLEQISTAAAAFSNAHPR
jgi:hypothetical protein